MRAAALLQHLPHPADTERPRRHKRSKRTATRTTNLHVAEPATGQDATVARVRLAGGPIDNASYTCSCGFVFAASVSTTVRCPHCGASQAW
jgi:rubrerythrin